LTTQQLAFTRRQLQKELVGLVFIAATDNRLAVLKFEPDLSVVNQQAGVRATGSWSENSGSFTVTLTGTADNINSPVKFDGDDRITMTKGGLPCVFDREL
jgi:hypothetical protein